MLRLLFLGDIIGEPGRRAVVESLPRLKEERALDFIVVNGENSAMGRGITPKISIDLLRAGAAVITTGDHIWDQREIVSYLDTEPRLLRPLNYPPGTPGLGSIVLDTPKGKVAVVNVHVARRLRPDHCSGRSMSIVAGYPGSPDIADSVSSVAIDRTVPLAVSPVTSYRSSMGAPA